MIEDLQSKGKKKFDKSLLYEGSATITVPVLENFNKRESAKEA